MWQLIRKQQGLPCSFRHSVAQEQVSTWERHQRCILLHETKPTPPRLNHGVFSKPYGDVIYEKLLRWLLDNEQHRRRQAVEHLIGLFQEQREHRVRSLKYGLLTILLGFLVEEEERVVRQRVGVALELLLREPASQKVFLGLSAYARGRCPYRMILKALDDPCDEVVSVTLQVCVACHSALNQWAVTEGLLAVQVMPVYLRLAAHTALTVRAKAFEALACTFDVKEAVLDFVKRGGVGLLTDAFRLDDGPLILAASEVVCRGAPYLPVRQAAVLCRTLEVVVPHLSHPMLLVRSAVAGAAAQLTIADEGKAQAVSVGLCERLSELVSQEKDKDLLAFLVRTVAHVAAYPPGRVMLQGLKNIIRPLRTDAGDGIFLTSAVDLALEQLSKN